MVSIFWITPTTPVLNQNISEVKFLFPPAYGKIDFKEECSMVQNHLPHDHGQTIEQELEHMPSTENFQTVADIFKQLGDGSRIRIFLVALSL